MSHRLELIKDRIRKWEFVEGVKSSTKMPSYFGFREMGLFKGYDFVILSEIDSNDFLSVYWKKLKELHLDATPISAFTIGIILE